MPKSLLNLTVKKYGPDYIHKKIYDGKVFIFNNSNYINNIINIVEQYFIEIFGIEIKTFLCDKDNLNFPEKEKLFLKFQNKIKLCRNISLNFLKFLNELGLSSELVFMDQSSLRYSPQKGFRPFGKLIPTPPHRDTWASNIFGQINFWFPIHDVSPNNSIYIVPKYFKKKIENNSKQWCYETFKKSINYPSAPYTKIKIKDHDKLHIKIQKGQVLCFSGHHLHGSHQNDKKRINLETRIVYKSKLNSDFKPINNDSYGKTKKKNWFKNVISNKYLD